MTKDDGWKHKYVVKCHGSEGLCWAVFSAKWHSISPMKKISPWFYKKHEAEMWIQFKWDAHVAKKFEDLVLGMK